MVDERVLSSTKIINQPGNREALQLWYKANLSTVRDDYPDLSARQLVILLAISTDKGPHTVRGLASLLSITKPAICRALDSLSRYKMAQRVVDQKDRRNVFIMPTERGINYLAELSETIMQQLMDIS